MGVICGEFSLMALIYTDFFIRGISDISGLNKTVII